MSDLIKEAVNAIGGLLTRNNKDMINVLRQPTPIKITMTVQATGGVIGGGFGNPAPVDLWQCPMSHEAWIHRIAVTSPSGTPGTPLSTGQVLVTGSTAGQPIFFLPLVGMLAPVLITEGRLSAPHLNDGERMQLIADGLPATCVLRFDFQIILVTGISADTPKTDKKLMDITP